MQVDPLDLADKQRAIGGDVPVSAFPRLREWLHSGQGRIEADLHFGRDADGRRVLQGTLSGELELVCQRCLTPFRLPVDRALSLVLVETDAEAGLVPEALDPLVVGTRREVHTTDLLEDELILGLPLVPRCAEVGRTCEPPAPWLEREDAPRQAAADEPGAGPSRGSD